jgi:methyl-accepting chemotaxis protein WspA
MVIFGLIGVIHSSTIGASKLEAESKNTQDDIKSANEMAYSISRMIGSSRGYVIFPKDNSYRGTYTKAYEDAINTQKDLQDNTDPQVKKQVSDLFALLQNAHQICQNVFSLVDANNIDAAKIEVAKPRIGPLDETRDKLIEALERQLNQQNQEIGKSQQFLSGLMAVGLLVTILATTVVALWISLPLQKKMSEVLDAAESMTEGSLSQNREKIQDKSEIEQLLNSFANVKQQLSQVVGAAESISEGDLSQNIEKTPGRSEIGKLLNSFHKMTNNLNALITQTQTSGIQITTSATQIAASGKQLEATVTEQLASTNEVTATAREIAATSKELVKTMDQVAQLSQETAIAASNSQSELTDMENVMRQLAEATMSISSKLGIMNEKASNINRVVTTITKVADQTNLLSLNAAIEAEKAGEYGAGFAVVAREIRRLADQTAVATLEIEQMVKQMQGAVSLGVMEIDKFNKSVIDSVNSVGTISSQLSHVIDQVQGLTPRFQQVSEGMEEQSLGAEQISEAMQNLSDASHQTADALRETNGALGNLNEAAQGLRVQISRFKLDQP